MERKLSPEADTQAAARKEDHIDLALESVTKTSEKDPRFYYEPILKGYDAGMDLAVPFMGKRLSYPIWVSSMTGGTQKAKSINTNLAKLCGKYGLGMGLGSCRQLLYDDQRLSEFDIREYLGDQPLMINLGIAQVEQLIYSKETERIEKLISKLRADGLIIHINPLQEWVQPEGDRILMSPIATIASLVDMATYPIIVKEVGQGFGPESLKALFQLPLAAIDLAGYGGTNFSKLELTRSGDLRKQSMAAVLGLGHDCDEMISYINELMDREEPLACKQVIISGGIRGFLDGYYYMKKCKLPSFYAQASGFLKYALDPVQLEQYMDIQIEGLRMANTYLSLKD